MEGGEWVGLIGPSGSGKSTLARLLSGYLRPLRGEVWVDGRPLPSKGFCPVQMVHQHPEKAVNPRWKLRRSLEESWSPQQNVLKEMGVDPAWLERYPYELSAGELQRICLVRALAPSTRYLVADEMTTMLDPVTQAQIWYMLKNLSESRELGVLLVTHDAILAQKLCNRIIMVDDLRVDQGVDDYQFVFK